MKAYAVRMLSWPGLVLIYAAESRAKAIAMNLKAATDAGYNINWNEHRVTRCPAYDDLAVRQGELGSDVDGERSGCLAACK